MTGQPVSPRVGKQDAQGSPLEPAERVDSAVALARAARSSSTRESVPGFAADFKRCPTCSERFPGDFRVCPRDATELENAPEDEDPLLGSVLGDSYEISKVIGEGGMGRVYEARHKRLTSKRFAIKVLHAELARQAEVVTRFQREAEATSGLSHPNVVAVIDVNRMADGRPFIVAELLEGEQLGDYLERVGVLSVSEAVHICRQICSALMAAHDRDIVHRDIKPENVFLIGTHSGRRAVKVLDFGISRVGLADATGGLTKTGMVMGTPAYMPPEQARGQRVDHRADIYAVGAILYQAVTGRQAFDGIDLMATLASVLSDEPVRPCTLNSALPPALEMTIQRAMAKQPSERHRTMRDLDAELAGFDSGGGGLPSAASDAPTVPVATLMAGAASLDAGAAAHRARLHIVLMSLVAAAWSLAGVLDAATSAIRWLRGSSTLSSTEVVLTALGVVCLLLAPSIAWVRYVSQRVWPSTPRAVELVSRLRGILVAAFVTYAAASLAIRVVESVVHGDPQATSWPGWAVLTFMSANLAALVTWGVERLRSRS